MEQPNIHLNLPAEGYVGVELPSTHSSSLITKLRLPQRLDTLPSPSAVAYSQNAQPKANTLQPAEKSTSREGPNEEDCEAGKKTYRYRMPLE